MTHLDEMTSLLYLEGQLERPRALELSAHAESCTECRALLRALERESRLLTQALVEEDEAVPARLLAPPVRDTTPWAWILSFGLAAAGAYTLWTGIVEPWREQLSQAGFGESNLLTMLLFRGAFWKGWESMANIVQFLAITTLGLLAFGLLRRSWRRWTTIAVVMGAFLAALALPPTAGAAETKHVHGYTLPAGETIHNDLILGTDTARIDGTVDGDLIVFCRSLTINGRVIGDVISFAQIVRINGQVDGNVRDFSNTLLLSGPVAKNAMAFADRVELDSKSRIGGGMMVFAGDAALDGRMNRDLLGFIGRSVLNGFIGGNARVTSDRLTIGPTAEIAGKVSYKGEHQPEVSPQAKLASPLEVKIVTHRPDYAQPRYYWHQVLAWGASFLFGLVVILLMPGFFGEVLKASRRYGPAFGFGALTLLTPILALIACATIVGLAVGIGTLLLWLVALYSAQVFVATWLGETLMGRPTGTGAVIGRLAVGLILIRIAGALPYVGGWIKLGVIIWGLGALTLALYRQTQSQPAPAMPAAA
jgi:cytoskeletal protein CcmA (bactofilin family)